MVITLSLAYHASSFKCCKASRIVSTGRSTISFTIVSMLRLIAWPPRKDLALPRCPI